MRENTKTRSNALPPVPLTDEQLEPLTEQGSIHTVWVPKERPKGVQTRFGSHKGDILQFWLETKDEFIKFAYIPGKKRGLAWYQHDGTPKGGEVAEMIRMSIHNEYAPLDDE